MTFDREADLQDLPTEATPGLAGVAVVGMSVRLPGAADIAAFWRNLRSGVESIRTFTDRELLEAGVEAAHLQDPNYVKARGALEGVDLFDAPFFGFTPREAETMDPQHRLFLEECWAALEDAGCNPDAFEGAIGVFAGANLTGYLIRNLAPNDELVKRVGPLQIRIRNDKDFLATLVAYKLNLKGPAVNVQTACSSSLVGVALACQSLLSYGCDMALAGGVSVTVPSRSGYLYQEGVYAPDGHCRAFDARARGTVLGDGVAVVVLKRLEDALAQGDTIRAVIRGFAVNNDGALKLDYTAPSVDGQAEVIAMAQALGEVEPKSVSYVEAHGTGTPLGDPIEITALTQAFRQGRPRNEWAHGFCALGSVKTNIGHLDAAAGTAGLVKTVLALEHREIPPTLHFERPNPQLDLAASPFRIVSRLEPWEVRDGWPRRAGVSSFGVGGTNAHVVLEEAPALPPSGPSRPWQPLVLSAASAEALEQAAARLAGHLEAHPEQPLADVAWTLARGRKAFAVRQAMVCRDREEAVALLRGAAPRRVAAGDAEPGVPRPVAFLFSGIGDHYVGMGRDLYDGEPVFRAAVDRCAALLQPLLGLDIREVIYPAGAPSAVGTTDTKPDLRRMLGRAAASGAHPDAAAAADGGEDRLGRTELLHPALFTLEYALAELWQSWGIRPGAMIGYSIGEYAAACLAGVFTLEGALQLVARRARIIEGLPGGAMLAVSLPEPELVALLAGFPALSLAAVNGPAFCVAAGAEEDVAALAAELARRDVVHRRLKARHPFHSRHLEPALPDFLAALAGIELAPPEIPFLSNVTGTWITPEQATDPRYWAEHMLRTVRFGDSVAELLQARDWALLEIGPGQSLSSIALQSSTPGSGSVALPSLPHEYEPQPARAFALHALGRLWTAGAEPDWAAFFAGEERRRVPLPAYPFERRRYWVEPVARAAGAVAAAPAASLDKRPDPGAWSYVPVWRQVQPLASRAGETHPDGPWLVLADEAGLGEALAADLAAAGRPVALAEIGGGFVDLSGDRSADRLGDRSADLSGDRSAVLSGDCSAVLSVDRFELDPGRPEDFETLLRALRERDLLPRHLVHLWTVPAAPGAVLDRSFYSLLFFAQAWGKMMGARADRRELSIAAVSSGVFEVTGEDQTEPEKAALAGPCRVLGQEYPGLTCRQIDLPVPRPGEGAAWAARWRGPVLAEVLAGLAAPSGGAEAPAAATAVALRGRRRWVREFEPLPLAEFDPEATRLRRGGVYVVTGGLGGIGLTLAAFLAERCAARLVLTGRSPFPAREEWAACLARGSEDAVARTLRRLQEIEAAGGEVLVCRADVTRRDEMAAVRRAALERFGAVHGVIHAAGQPPGGLIQLKTRATAAAVLAPKVEGTRVLDEVFGGPGLDFLLLCSSLTALTGTLGLVDHAAANAFLDAYAHQSAARGGTRVISVNWDSWLEVGQAAQAGVAARLANLIDGAAEAAAAPVLEWELPAVAAGEGEGEVLRTRVAAGHWLVAEHRLQGVGLVPGTAYLEMVRRAALAGAPDPAGPVRLRGLVFSQPCLIPAGQSCLLRVRRGGTAGPAQLVVESAPLQAGDAGPWREHARCTAELLAAEEPARHAGELARAAGLPVREARPELDGQAAWVEFGERWRSLLRELRVGVEEGWARLELPEAFRADLEGFGLHPAVTDVATGIARVLGEGAYLPAGYDEVTVHGPLPAEVQSHFRLRPPQGGAGSGTLVCDVTVGNRAGRPLLEVRGYALRRFDPAALPPLHEIAQAAEEPAARPGGDWSLGLLPQEGAAVFGRLLGRALDEPQVVVSVRDFSAVLARMENLTGVRAEEHMHLLGAGGLGSGGASAGRRVTRAPYVAPRTALEAILRDLFQDMLGGEQVGIHDNFFDLGGNSLVATQLISRLHATHQVELTLRTLFEAPSVAELAVELQRQPGGGSRQPEPIRPLPRAASTAPLEFPLSFAQQRLWFIDQIASDSAAYNVATGVRLRGRLQVAAMEEALNGVVGRHESLRTTFGLRGEQPVQRIAPALRIPLLLADFASLPEERREAEAARQVRREVETPFDLTTGPLLRGCLLRLAPEDHLLLLDVHHIVSDNRSQELLIEELAALYGVLAAGHPAVLPTLPIQYVDYAQWQLEWMQGEVLARQLAFWKERLAGAPPSLDLPRGGRQRPEIQTYRAGHQPIALSREATAEIERFAQRERVTLFTALFAAFNVLLHKLTRRQDIVIGTNVSGRQRQEVKRTIGFFSNNLALRTDLTGNPTFRDLLGRVREVLLSSFAHQDLPFERLVAELRIDRDPSRHPLVQVMFNVQDLPIEKVRLAGIATTPLEPYTGRVKFDLTVFLLTLERGLSGAFIFNSDLFDPQAVALWARDFELLLQVAVARPEARLDALLEAVAEERSRQRAARRGEIKRENVLKLGLIKSRPPREAEAQDVMSSGGPK